MKIVILQGSPNKKGSTNILVENFSQGRKQPAIASEDLILQIWISVHVPDAFHADMRAPASCMTRIRK